jgi:hypothetical protein
MAMSQPYYRGMTVQNLAAWPDDRVLWIQAGDWALPGRFRVQGEIDGFAVAALIVTADRGPQVAELFVRQPAVAQGAPITQNLLRQVAIDQLVREASVLVRRRAELVDADRGWFRIEGIDAVYGGRKIREGRRSMTGDDLIAEVAALYERAVGEGLPPVKAVAAGLPCSRSHAGRLVGQARTAGLLRPTTRGRTSSAEPAALEPVDDHEAG